MLRSEIQKQIRDAIGALWPDVAALSVEVSAPEQPDHGDYASSVALLLSRALKQDPMKVAEELAKQLKKIDDQKGWKMEIAKPGFLNFFIADQTLLCLLKNIVENPETFGESAIGNGKTVMVEYFQLNVAKPPHVGHIRSAIIGDALKRMLLSQGYRAVSDTHVGDWGTQFGFLLLEYKGLETVAEQGAFLSDIQTSARAYTGAVTRAITEPERREMAKKEFAKLEHGDAENRRIWEKLVETSMRELKRSAEHLGLLPFDEHGGESFYEDKMRPIVELALEKGIAKRLDDGAIIVDLINEGLDEAVLMKSDGASTYLLRDLATIQYRKQKWEFWKNLYVVDVRQSHHFRQLFRVAELLGLDGAGESEHVAYGFMKLPEGGAISTRGGTSISLDVVLTEATTRARKVIAEKTPDLKDADDVARMVGIGALKYFDLSHHRKSDITFAWDRALSFEGNTGPYLQYTHARFKSIVRKSGAHEHRFSPDVALDSAERNLLAALIRFPEAIEDGLTVWSPHVLAAYLYDLAVRANGLYHAAPILAATDEEKKRFLLALVFAAASTLKKGLHLLGIDAPEEM